MKSKIQCPLSISRTCLAQGFGLVGWCYSQVEGDPLSKRIGLSSIIGPGSLDSGAGALNNANSPVSWSLWPFSSFSSAFFASSDGSSFTAFLAQLVLEDGKMLVWYEDNYDVVHQRLCQQLPVRPFTLIGLCCPMSPTGASSKYCSFLNKKQLFFKFSSLKPSLFARWHSGQLCL